MADQSAKFFDGTFFPPKREDAIAETARTLAETTANLDAYIERRAQEIAEARIAEAREEYLTIRAEMERQAAFDRQRASDLEAELRRHIAALEQSVQRLRKDATS